LESEDGEKKIENGVVFLGPVAQVARIISGAINFLCHSERSRGISHFNNY